MKIQGSLIVVAAIAAAAVALAFNCAADGKDLVLANGRHVPMKCYWTAMAEVGLMLPALMLGVVMFFSRRRESLRNLSIMGVAVAAVTMLLPTALIGVCADMTANCSLVMRPAMLFIGALVGVVSLLSLYNSTRMQEIAA